MAILYFHTTGAVTAVFPLSTNINLSATTTNTTYASGFFAATDTVKLLAINLLKPPTGGDDTLTLVDKAGTAITQPLTVPVTVSTTTMPIYPDGGILMPTGGFGVTTTAAAVVYQFVFDVTKSVN